MLMPRVHTAHAHSLRNMHRSALHRHANTFAALMCGAPLCACSAPVACAVTVLCAIRIFALPHRCIDKTGVEFMLLQVCASRYASTHLKISNAPMHKQSTKLVDELLRLLTPLWAAYATVIAQT